MNLLLSIRNKHYTYNKLAWSITKMIEFVVTWIFYFTIKIYTQ